MLEDTGERVILEKMNIMSSMLIEHLARYHFASQFAEGRVLDFACGTGYGTHIIAKKCKEKVSEVIGVDKEKEALKYAEHTYYHPKSTFKQTDVADKNTPEQLGKFDYIVSFETLEHIQDEKQFLDNIYEMLYPGGTLILSTPFGEGRGKPCKNPFHVHQLTEEEFQELFVNYASVSYYYQENALIIPAESAKGKSFPLGIVVCRK
ncbi:MAG TPA: class I SAM-dependent methyltransferase [Candidatus Avamphibacillus sp.]|nr:class I SAM-dependent methyltransferase [Candidatus Avamphibacillus sp.]